VVCAWLWIYRWAYGAIARLLYACKMAEAFEEKTDP
jgi:hypothetical protein